MPANLWAQIATGLRLMADACDGGYTAVSGAAPPSKAVVGLTALARVVAPLSRVLAGKGDFDDDAKLAEAIMDGVALAFPPSAKVVTELELALAGLTWIVDEVRSRPSDAEPFDPLNESANGA